MSNDDDAVRHLLALGLSEYEARLYVALVAHGPLTGYEVSKRSGVPRPNAYAALQRLEQRGAVAALGTTRGARYAAHPPADVLDRLERAHRDHVRQAGAALARLGDGAVEPVARILGGENELLAQARRLIDGARERVLVAVIPETARWLSPPVDEALARGVSITTLCTRACPEPCGACRGALFRHDEEAAATGRWLVVIADDREALAADLSADGAEPTGILTRHPALVQLAASGIRDGIAAGELVRALAGGPPLDSAADALDGLALTDARRRSWLDRIRDRIGLTRP